MFVFMCVHVKEREICCSFWPSPVITGKLSNSRIVPQSPPPTPHSYPTPTIHYHGSVFPSHLWLHFRVFLCRHLLSTTQTRAREQKASVQSEMLFHPIFLDCIVHTVAAWQFWEPEWERHLLLGNELACHEYVILPFQTTDNFFWGGLFVYLFQPFDGQDATRRVCLSWCGWQLMGD